MAANVALFGKFCAGKTTLAESLVDLGYIRVSMAANMKQIVKDVYGTLDKSETVEVTRRDGTRERITVRQVLQGIGESVKAVDRDLWLKWFLKDSQFFLEPQVMDDARLVFEAESLRDRGWLLVKVETPEHVRMTRYFQLYGKHPTSDELNHPTETELEKVQFDLVVDGVTSPALVAESIAMFAEDN